MQVYQTILTRRAIGSLFIQSVLTRLRPIQVCLTYTEGCLIISDCDGSAPCLPSGYPTLMRVRLRQVGTIENQPTGNLSAHITKKAQIIDILEDIKGVLTISTKNDVLDNFDQKYVYCNTFKSYYNNSWYFRQCLIYHNYEQHNDVGDIN